MPDKRDSRRRRTRIALEPLEGRGLLSAAVHSVLAAGSVNNAGSQHSEVRTPTPARWAWLVDTYWYVPTLNLGAMIYDSSSGAIIPVRDQTVYHIAGYSHGYFWGQTVAQFGSTSPSGASVVGSVTPQGRVLLSFNSGSDVTQGYGVMTRMCRKWTMENQMFTPSTTGVQVGHWAYMVQTRPGMKSWNSLPSVGVSVPTFLSNYSLPSPTSVN